MTNNRRNSASRGAGFTLLEILIVIVIIGMLAGLTTSVLVSARRSVSNAIVSTQEAQLSIALDEYKNRFGEYPPDLSDDVAVMRHIKKRWPRYNVPDYVTFVDHIKMGCKLSSSRYGSDADYPADLNDCNGEHVWDIRRNISSLVFWLGGLPNADGVPSGFYANPKAPLGFTADGTRLARPTRAQREKPLFAFERKYLGTYFSAKYDDSNDYFYPVNDEDSLWDDSLNAYCYTPAYCQGDYPIVYFRPSVNVPYTQKSFYLGQSAASTDVVTCAVPYARNFNDGSWYEESRFQLIHPGADGMFGPNENETVRDGIPATQPKYNVYLEDADNIVNFVDSGTLESEYQE